MPSPATETLTLEISQDLLAALKVGVGDLGRNICLLAAITYFQEKKLSLGKAAQLAGLNRLDFMDILTARGLVIFDYDESVLTSELNGINEFPHPL
jgi:predicted HTH domain antitoxin